MTKANKFKIKGLADNHPAQKEFDKYMKAKSEKYVRHVNSIEDILQEEREYRTKMAKTDYGAYLTAMNVIGEIERKLIELKKEGIGNVVPDYEQGKKNERERIRELAKEKVEQYLQAKVGDGDKWGLAWLVKELSK